MKQTPPTGGVAAYRAPVMRLDALRKKNSFDLMASLGYALVKGIGDLQTAKETCWQLINDMSQADYLLQQHLPAKLEVLEYARIPPEGGEDSSFLGLHFDWGHPLFPRRPETLYLFLGLYFAPDQEPGTAITRVVPLAKLLAQRSWGSFDFVEQRLAAYARSHGSSWDWEEDSGHRVSCFARILDALNPEPRLTNFRTIPREKWYAVSHAGHEFENAEDEEAFYASSGLLLKEVEERFVLQPGDLLVLNNLSTIHARLGARRPGELHQYLFGLRDVSPSQSVVIRHWLTHQLSSDEQAEDAT